eukprot:7367136-Prorocentrum_lima.AAC.1
MFRPSAAPLREDAHGQFAHQPDAQWRHADHVKVLTGMRASSSVRPIVHFFFLLSPPAVHPQDE